MLTDEFKREPRYLVFKAKDALAHLSACQLDRLQELGETVAAGRSEDGKPPLNVVVVEHDWPEFEPTWAAIEARMTGRAIESEVRAEAQEPVAWFAFADSNGPVPLELWGFDLMACKHAVLENARSVGWKGTIEGYLLHMSWTIRPLGITAPHPPAPCPWCAVSDARLHGVAVACATAEQERDALQAKVAEQSAEIERVLLGQKECNDDIQIRDDHIAQQAERIAELDEANEHHRELARVSRDAELNAVRIAAKQAALIEKCEVALSRSTRKLAAYYGLCSGDKELTETVLPLANEALAAIAAQKGGSV